MKKIDMPDKLTLQEQHEYRCLQLIISVFATLQSYLGITTQQLVAISIKHNLYQFIHDNYDFYHTVGNIYIVNDICEHFELPKGRWE